MGTIRLPGKYRYIDIGVDALRNNIEPHLNTNVVYVDVPWELDTECTAEGRDVDQLRSHLHCSNTSGIDLHVAVATITAALVFHSTHLF